MEQQTNGKPPSKGGVGPVIGIIIIIILLALGSLYYFTVGIDGIREQQYPEDTMSAGESNDLDAIEADVDATDLSNLDQASANIDSSLETQ